VKRLYNKPVIDVMSKSKFKPSLSLYWGIALSAMMAMSHVVCAQTEAVKLDRVVAIVDQDVVLESEFNERKSSVLERLRGQYQQLPPDDVLDQQILEQLIIERIELSMAERYEIRVSEEDVDQAIARVLQNNRVTLSQLEDDLKRRGLSMLGLRKQLRNEITVSQLEQGVVTGRIKVTEQEIDNFLASTDGKFATSPDYHVGHILIALPSGVSADEVAEAEKKATDGYCSFK
jgi:peptidyl-prolyl cis-trans isomerase SurA